ncbi:MAG: GNAT family N-acetyltransferase [Candidatus Rokuibacteriota bacterium]|nr:MAG: GNAT family N-acetyltransferase [Candidatus Rokubacteria bacterium]PYN25820.1 MAG: GNAT family N-acetyltransferase [Candidatus Rokubacteria bacterium]
MRRARPSDAAALTRIAHASKRHWRYPEEWIALWREALTVTPWVVERAPVYCAEEGGAVVGFYALSGRAPAMELEHCWVLPARIGRGIGARLLEHAAATGRAARASTLSIASDPFAVGFYRRMGARPAGTVPSTPRGRTLPLLLLRV